jgi:hypothetical protein
VNYPTIPAMALTGEEGAMLQSLLAKGPVKLEFDGTSVSPYRYDLVLPENGRIPEQLTYRIDSSNTEKVVTRYHGSGKGDDVARELRFTFRPYTFWALGFGFFVPLGTERTEYFSANDTVYLRDIYQDSDRQGRHYGKYTTYQAGETSTESWFGQLLRPATLARYGSTARTGDQLAVRIPEYLDASGGHYGRAETATDTVTAKLYANGALLGEATTAATTFAVPAGEAAYTLTVDATRQADWAAYSTQTSTEWSFTSATTTAKQALPLLSVDYDLDLDLYNRAEDRCQFTFGLKVRHQEGSTPAPITRLTAWASYDDGATWKAIGIGPDGAGGYRATVQHPAVRATNGYVALRVKATDASGYQIDQTVKRAYGLK